LCNPGATVIISGFGIGLGPESKVVNEFNFEALSANTINCSRVNQGFYLLLVVVSKVALVSPGCKSSLFLFSGSKFKFTFLRYVDCCTQMYDDDPFTWEGLSSTYLLASY
jgi:hypothetical protein